MSGTAGMYLKAKAVADAERPERGWQERAACRNTDPAVFFPLRGEDAAAAKAICAGCPVAEECLAYALTAYERHGVWGGASERERRRMRKRAGLSWRRESAS